MKKIRIVIADDHGLVREGFKSILQQIDGVDVIASVSSGEEAIACTNENNPDIVLMDIVMRGMTGIEAARWIKEQNPNVKVVLISSEVSPDFVRDGLKAGIDGYMSKDSTKEAVAWALETVMRGERYLGKNVLDMVTQDAQIATTPTEKRNAGELTKRENEIFKMIASGKSIKEIADELFISARTVETHKLNIQSKLQLQNTAQLVRYAIENQLI